MPGLSAINAGRRLTACQYHHLDHPRLCPTLLTNPPASHSLPRDSTQPSPLHPQNLPAYPFPHLRISYTLFSSTGMHPRMRNPPVIDTYVSTGGVGKGSTMMLTAPATATGSKLVMIDRGQAGDWQRALATVGGRLPVGWDGAGERTGGVAGYDLVLAAPPHPERPGLVPALRRAGGAGRADPPGSRGGGAGGVGGVHLRGRNRVAHGGRPRVRL